MWRFRAEPVGRTMRFGISSIFIITTTFGVFPTGRAFAQKDPNDCRLLWSDSAGGKTSENFSARLTANAVPQTRYLSVYNPSDLRADVQLELLSNGASLPTTRQNFELNGKETRRVVFDIPATPTPKDPTDKPAGAAAPDTKGNWIDLTGPLAVRWNWSHDKQNKREETQELKVDVATGGAAVTVSDRDVTFTPADGTSKNRLRVKVAAAGQAGNDPSEIVLEVSPALIPGLKAKKTSGATRGKLLPGQDLELVVDDLQFDIESARTGYVCVWVNGVPGPVFEINFETGDTKRVQLPLVRLECDRYTQPGKYTVRTIAANAPDGPRVTTKIGVDRNKNGTYEAAEQVELRGTTDRRVSFATSKDGGLAFKVTAKEWVHEFDMAETYGECPMRVQLFDDGKEVTVLDARGRDTNQVVQSVTFDATEPVDVQIDVRRKAIRGKPLSITARGKDDESRVSKVQFFLGKPAGGKPPMGAELIDAEPADADRTVWKADLPLKPDQKLVEVSVQFTNGVGLSAFDTIKIELEDTEVPTTGNIKGIIVNKDGAAQADTTVVLLDSDKKEKGKIKTNDKGEFEFKDLAPGSYMIDAKRGASGNSGTGSATVAKGKTTDVKIEIKRF